MSTQHTVSGLSDKVWRDMLFLHSLDGEDPNHRIGSPDVLRAIHIMARIEHQMSYRALASELSCFVFKRRFAVPDITVAGGGDSEQSARSYFEAFIESVTPRHSEKVAAEQTNLPTLSGGDVTLADSPGVMPEAALASVVVPGDAKRASEEVDRGDCEPLSFYIDRFGRPRDHSRHLLNLAAGTDAGVQIRHVGDGARSQLHRAQLLFNEQDATLTVSGLPVDVDAQTLRLRIGSVLLRPAENSSKSTAVFSVRDAWTHGDEGSTHKVAELLEPGIARAIEERLKSQG